MKEKIKIGNAGGFLGDDLNAFRRQLTGGDLDYITMDFLAEITMSILTKQKLKDPELGYVTDFVDQIYDNAELINEKGVKIISNAGGINPSGCAEKIAEVLKEKNIDLKIGVVEGCNIIDRIHEFYDSGVSFKNMETDEDFEPIKDKVISANVYLGVLPIVELLRQDADIIICGRVTDTSVTVAPMIYEFNWDLNDWDKLASGIIAAHIIECGAQCSGGNFTDWYKVTDWLNFGYPIIEMNNDSSFVVTKHKNTGGLVSVDTVKEQLVYEMGDPEQFISPDVIADFTSIIIEEDDEDRVRISGVTGYPATNSLKVSMAYEDGYKAGSSIIISEPYAVNKANKFAEIFWNRLNIDFEKTNSELIGFSACHKNLIEKEHSNEILLKLSAYDSDKEKIKKFAKSIAPLILSGPPGVAVTGGRPRPHRVMTFWPALIDKEFIKVNISLINTSMEKLFENTIATVTGYEDEILYEVEKEEAVIVEPDGIVHPVEVKIEEICLARSGDKGDTANLGIIARSPDIYEFMKNNFTEAFIKNLFDSFCKGKVTRYELDNLCALNFLLEQSLDGGGTKSLMIDAQGKTLAQAFLNQTMTVPKKILESIIE